MATWSFDVAVVPAELNSDGRRSLERKRWRRVVVEAQHLPEAALTAAQLVGCSGMVTDVLYRD